MPSTYSNLKIELIGIGEQTGTWGDTTNNNFQYAIEEAITGSGDVTFSNTNVTLSFINSNLPQTARNLRLNLIGVAATPLNLIVPAIEKLYLINNYLRCFLDFFDFLCFLFFLLLDLPPYSSKIIGFSTEDVVDGSEGTV